MNNLNNQQIMKLVLALIIGLALLSSMTSCKTSKKTACPTNVVYIPKGLYYQGGDPLITLDTTDQAAIKK